MTPGFRLATAALSLLAVITTARAGDDKAPAAQNSPAAPASKNPKSPRVLVTISKETTYITEPLRKDGYVDYVAALNERASKGATPENNAAVLFWKAVGPKAITKANREEYFKRLSIPVPLESGDYLISFDEYMAAQRNALPADGTERKENEIRAATDFMDSDSLWPWTKNKFPLHARWIAANEKALSLILDASNRPRRFDPLIGSALLTALLPAVQAYREAASALLSRAMLRIGEGNIEAACEDLLTMHRLARLVGQGPTLIEGLVAVSIDGIACRGEEAMLKHGGLSSAAARKMLSALTMLPALPKMVEKVDAEERFSFLDSVALVARNGHESISDLTGPPKPRSEEEKKRDLEVLSHVDWDVVLRMGNTWYDRLVEAFRKPTALERAKAFRKIEAELREMSAKSKNLQAIILSALGNSRETISRRIGEIFVALLLPAISSVGVVEDRAVMQFQVTELGFAMAAYHADHGSYPAKLAELAPKYVREIPKDVFTEEELHYKVDGDRYIIYSVGPNGIDDGGKGYNDRKNSEEWDDIAVAVPDPKAAK